MGTLTLGIMTAPQASRNFTTFIKLAQTAQLKGHQVNIWLSAAATIAAKKGQQKFEKHVNFEDIMKDLIEKGAEVKICESCAELRGVTNEEIIEGMEFATMTWYVTKVIESDRSLMIGEE